MRMRSRYRAALLAALVAAPSLSAGQATSAPTIPANAPTLPTLHHVGLNSVDPERAIAWYRRLWPTATRTEVAGQPGVQGEMLLLFQQVERPPTGGWRHDLHRPEAQSPFWHIGAFTNTSTLPARLQGTGVVALPLWLSPTDTVGTWRSGLAPYAGTLTAAQLASAPTAPPREGGFAYVVAPDGALFEFTGGPGTKDAFAHLHFFHEQPLCAANWYVTHLGMELPPVRDSAGVERPRPLHAPCDAPYGEAGWPSQVLDHVAFGVRAFDALHERLMRAGVRVIEPMHPFGAARAFMIEDPDGLAIELVEIP